MSDHTLTYDGTEFPIEPLLDAIEESLEEAPSASYADEKTTGVTITDEIIIVGDGCDDPDARVVDVESEESVFADLTNLREEAENTPIPFENYLRETNYLYSANDIVDSGETPIPNRRADAVIEHDESGSMHSARITNDEIQGLQRDDSVSLGPIKTTDENVLFVGVNDER